VAGGWRKIEQKLFVWAKFWIKKNMIATLEKKPQKTSVSGKVGFKKPASGSVVTKSPKTPLSKKPFAYLIGCIEGTPDLSSRKGYNSI